MTIIRTMTGPKTAPAGLPVAEDIITVDSCLMASNATAPMAAPIKPDFLGTFVRGRIIISHHMTMKLAISPSNKPLKKKT